MPWHSTGLVNWPLLAPAMSKPLGTIWAVDLCKHDGRYFIYMAGAPDGKPWSIHAIWADRRGHDGRLPLPRAGVLTFRQSTSYYSGPRRILAAGGWRAVSCPPTIFLPQAGHA